jgi:acetoacetyl-CoA synthetase
MTEAGGWTPDVDAVAHANITQFADCLRDSGRGDHSDYQSLWQASVSDVPWFWEAIWDYFDVRATTRATKVLDGTEITGAQWFPGTKLNHVSQEFRHGDTARPTFAHYLRRVGVTPGDRVVGYLPNIGETVAAFLAAAAVGATWAVCNPGLAVSGVTTTCAPPSTRRSAPAPRPGMSPT